jgi:hypothetical protein
MKRQMHLINKSKLARVALLGAVLLSLLACEKQEPVDPYYFMQPQLPVLTPMKLDRAGAKYTLNFWVVPELGSRTTYGYFIGIRTTQPNDAGLTAIQEVDEFLRLADVPLEVKLIKLDESAQKKIQLFGPPILVDNSELKYAPLSDDVAPIRKAVSADNDLLIKKKLLDLNQRQEYFQFASVHTPDPGYYRLEVRVLKDNPKASNLATDLIVSNHRKGK